MQRSRYRSPRALPGAALLVLLAAAVPAPAASRVVAVADVHADLPQLRSILATAGLVDASGAWVGGDAVLVQLGDLVDRGPNLRGTLDFVADLEKKARAAGGRVVPILGNHEVMNMTGDLRYVTAANYAEFADEGSEKRRQDAWRRVQGLRKKRAKKLGTEPLVSDEARDAWLAAHPPGYLEHREAFSPSGVYGRALRARKAVFVEGGTAFLHGGLSPAFGTASLEEVDRRVHEDLAAFDRLMETFVAQGLILPFFDLRETSASVAEELQALDAAEAEARAAAEQKGKTFTPRAADATRRKLYAGFLDWGSWAINSPDGPLWFRGFSQWTDEEGAAAMPKLLAAAGVQRFVVGHTVQEDRRIRVRFGGSVFLIDTGMLTSYGGRPSALELVGGTAAAIYPGEPRQVVWPAPAAVTSVRRKRTWRFAA